MVNKENLKTILLSIYENEIELLEEDQQIILPENLNEAIKYCEENNFTNYLAYNLLILKKELQE